MKAIFISFNQAWYESILGIMDRNNISGFTYWENVAGRGSRGGEPHYGNHAWPTLNSSIWTIVDDEKVQPLLKMLQKLDAQAPAQGLRAFVLPVEQTI